jgi:putative ABC transport system permease protein
MSIREFFSRLGGMFGGERRDPEMQAEFESHVQMAADEYLRRGMNAQEARRRALMDAGGLASASEAVRDQRGLPSIESIVADLRYGFRALRRAPGFSLVVILTLALGIGANTAIFSVVRGVLLKPLPHRDGSRLVYLRQSSNALGASNLTFSVPEVRDLRTGVPSLGAGIAEYSPFTVVLFANNNTMRLNAGLVTGNYFDVMGLSPILGRVTRASDDGTGVAPVMILTHEFWMRRFNGDSGIVGKVVQANGTPAEVIGVLQPAPFFPTRMDVLMNMVISSHHTGAAMTEVREHRMTEVVARLTPTATVAQAQGEVSSVFQRLQRDFPGSYNAAALPKVAVIPFKTAIGEQASLTLWLLMGAAAFVMIIAVANVANLSLMRGVRRERELVVRASLGAGIARLRRLLLVENLLLALGGAAVGVALAVAGVPLLVSLANRYSNRASEIQLDGMVLAFTLALAIVVALIFSLVAPLPTESSLSSVTSAGRRSTAGSRKQRLQRGLVVVQVAVSVVLLAGAGLLTRTMLRLAEVPTGLQTEEVLTMQVNLLAQAGARADSSQIGDARQRFVQISQELASLPGVTHVGFGATPLRAQAQMDIDIEGRVLGPAERPHRADWRGASLDYFKAAGIPLVKGRTFETADQAPGAKVAVINQTLAAQIFPGEEPIGKRFAIAGVALRLGFVKKDDWLTVVGVVGATQDGGLDAKPMAAFFLPLADGSATSGTLVIGTEREAAAQIPAATSVIKRIAPSALIDRVATIAQIKAESVAPRRLNAALISSFGLLAVLIAGVGIAGVLAFSVNSRTTEIGIRMSLGANRGQVERMILGEGGRLVIAGLAIGVVTAFFATRWIQGLLFNVAPNDPVTFAGVATLMAVIGLVACWIPALRAARVDPAITMRAG